MVQAEESTDAVITEEVQDSEHEEATPDAPSTEDKMMEEGFNKICRNIRVIKSLVQGKSEVSLPFLIYHN